MSPVVEQPARARLITDAPHHKALAVIFRYDGADPLSVSMVFPRGVSPDSGEDRIVWEFTRELLASGMREPSGDGGVRVWPCGRAQVVVEYHGPDGVAVVQFDTAALGRFLKSSYTMVPVGTERQYTTVGHGSGPLLPRK